MTKRKNTQAVAKAAPAQTDTNTVEIRVKEGNEACEIAKASLRPGVSAAFTAKLFKSQVLSDDLSVTDLVHELAKQSESVNAGDLRRCEAMLTSQAHTLDAIFNSLAMRCARNMGHYTQTAELYMRLALKAQSQCRSTIEAIAEIKNPRSVAFVKQANIAAGNQQVNNGTSETIRAGAHARAEESAIPQNKLMEANNGERMDIGASRPTSSSDSRVQALG